MADLLNEYIGNRKGERGQEHRTHAIGQNCPVSAQTGYEVSFFDAPLQPQSASQPCLAENDRERR
jgi:hypothetical protein